MKIKIFISALVFSFLITCSKNPADSSFTEEKGKTDNGYFFITNPRSETKVNLDSALNILWIASNKVVDSPNVRISLYKDSSLLKTIASSAPNSGSFRYVLNRIGSGIGYQIKISTFPDTSKYDFCGYFQIYSEYSGTITITYPASSTRLQIGNSDTLRWKTTGFPGPRLRLELYCDTSFVSTIVEGMATTLKKYPWSNISTPLGTNNRYRIKVVSEKDESIYNFSNYFTIASIYNGGFSIKTPSSSTVWSSGYKYSILWDTTGSPGSMVTLQLYTDNDFHSLIASNVPNNGKYDWTTKKGMTTGSDYRIKVISSQDAGLFDFSTQFTITGIDADRYEPDNGRSSSHRLTFDTLENRSITLNDTDWVSFSADSGSPYLILSKGQGTFQIDCQLYYESESTSVESNTSLSDGRLCWYWPCMKSGRYSFRIISGVTGNAGEYFFRISRFDPSELASFTAPSASSKINAGSTVTVSWLTDSLIFGSSVELYLYKGSNRMVSLSSEPIPNSGKFEWVIPEGFVSGNDYSLRMLSSSDDRIYGKGPQFSITGMTPDQFENDGTRKLASDFTLGESQEHTISCNDTDWVRFAAKSGSRYLIMLNCTDTFTTAISLFRDSSTSVVISDESNVHELYSTIWNCTASSNYYLRIISSIGGLAGTYNLRVAQFDSLNSLKFSSPESSSVLLVGTQTTISWIPDSVITGDSVSISIYKGNAVQSILVDKHPSSSPSYTWNISDTLIPGTDYRIKIANAEKPILCGYSPKFFISDMEPDKFENDGSSSKASQAFLDSVQQHNITYSDTDFIKFSADSGMQYLISVTGENQFRISGSLYPSSSTTALVTFSSNTSGQSHTLWQCNRSGVFNVRITSISSSNTGVYTFKVTRFNPETIASFNAPGSGTSWSVDSTYTITWTPDKDLFGTSVALNLYMNSNRLISIVSSVANDGSYEWKIPSGLSSGTDYSIQIVSIANAAFYGFSPHFSINGMAGDEYEQDNSFSQAHTYPLSTTEVHNITFGDTDWVKFSVDSGAEYLIRLNGTNSFRTTIAFYYEDNWKVFDPFVSGTKGEINEIWHSQKSTTAYARIISSGSAISQTGTYSFTISKFDPLKTVKFISPSTDTTISEGTSFKIEWVPDSTFLGTSVLIYLFKSNFQLSRSLESNSGISTISIPKGRYITGNDYRIKIANMMEEQFYGYSPFLTITGIDAVPDGYENDNTSDVASIISLDAVQEHNLINDDIDFIQFQMRAGEQYVIMGDQASNSISMNIYKGSLSSLYGSTSFSGQCRKLITSTSDEPCYIRISPASNLYSTYSLKVTRFDSTKAMKITSPTEGMMITSGEISTITWSCDTSIYGKNVTLYVYKGNDIYTMQSSANKGSYSWSAPGAVSGDDYRIKIVSNIDTALCAFSPVFRIAGVDVDDFEPDDTPDEASTITLGAYQLHNFTIRDTDWVKLIAQNGQSYIIEYTNDQSASLELLFYDSASIQKSYSYIFREYVYSSKATDTRLWTCKASGSYYLKCYSTNSTTLADYKVKVIQIDTSQTIEVSAPVSGTSVKAGSSISVAWTPKADNFGPMISLRLYKGNEWVLSRYSVPNTGSFNWPLPLYVENGTDYRILVAPDGAEKFGTYSQIFTVTGGLEADSYEPDNLKDEAKPIVFGESQKRTLLINDSDWVQFQADSGTTYIITDSMTSRHEVSIYFSNNSSIIKNFIFEKEQPTKEWLCTKTGTYYLKIMVYHSITGNSGSPGRYSVMITTQ